MSRKLRLVLEGTAAADFKCWWVNIFSELEEVKLLLNLMLKEKKRGQLPELMRLECFILMGKKANFRDFQRMLFACLMKRV